MGKEGGIRLHMTISNANATKSRTNIAVVGAGYWGKNHVRNFAELGALTHVCDSNCDTLGRFLEQYPQMVCTDSFDEILRIPDIHGVVIATPAATHYELTEKALEAGKDVLVEKPLSLAIHEAEALVKLAAQKKAILMVGHILLYHPAVLKLKQLITDGYLGRIYHIQSNRLSMGIVRSEENILWSFAPHDVSVILHLLGEVPSRVEATGNCHLQRDVEDVTITNLEFPSGVGAHIYVSWMNPFKEHRLVVIGDKRMAVFEDSRPDKKLQVYNHNFDWVNRAPVPVKGAVEEIPFESQEPLRSECQHFLECIQTRNRPRSDGEEGLRTLSVLSKCFESMKAKSSSHHQSPTSEAPKNNGWFAHETAQVDEPSEIGSGTKIWHSSHISKNARIGQKCNIGQNVYVGAGVTIGDGCKIQNNVSVYEGVTLEDYVFCGPSMVFTNVHNPRCEIPRMKEIRPTLVKRGATIGANATIICGNTVGQYAFIGSGAVVTKDVLDHALLVGNPARQIGWMCRCGIRLQEINGDSRSLACPSCGAKYRVTDNTGLETAKVEETMQKVPLLDLKAQYLSIKDEIDAAIKRVIESQRFILGPEVEALEREVADYCGCKHGIGVSSGTDALLVSLMALGIGPGDEVITTPFTFFATVGSIMRLGATPVFADIDPDTFNIDPEQIRKAVTANTKAILPVHLFGQAAEMDPILEIAQEHGIPVVEDAAQAIGAEYRGRRAGSMGTLGCFSFFPSKNLGAFGDGGMITTDNDELAEKIRIIRNQGAKPKYFHKIVGGNFRLDAIQAAILRVKLRHLDSWTEKRIQNAAYYTKGLQDAGLVADGKVIPPKIVQSRHIFNQYVIRVKNRDGLKAHLKENGIDTEIYYPKAMHLQECMKHLAAPSLPESEAAADEVLALPIYPELGTEHLEYALAQILAFHDGSSLSSLR